jgi:hypothetical protein
LLGKESNYITDMILIRSAKNINFLQYFGDFDRDTHYYFPGDDNIVCLETKCFTGSVARDELLQDIQKWQGVIDGKNKILIFFYDKYGLVIAEYYVVALV